jgi:hypothetical protein
MCIVNRANTESESVQEPQSGILSPSQPTNSSADDEVQMEEIRQARFSAYSMQTV